MGQPLGVLAAGLAVLVAGLAPGADAASDAAPLMPVLWSAGGQSAGPESAGQAARMSVDPAGNVAVVSGPAKSRDLAVTSYTDDGVRRWRRTITPASGTFIGDWVVAATNGDVVAVGRSQNASGHPIGITMVRYTANGTRQWRRDVPGVLPSVGRLVVDPAGNAYLSYNALGDGQDIRVIKYSPTGGVLWSAVIASEFASNDIATSLALGPDGTDIIVTGDIIGGATWIIASYDTASGSRNWLVQSDVGVAARDVVVSADRVFVTGQGNEGTESYLSVVAYDRSTGESRWRTDNRPATNYAGVTGLRIALAPDGGLVVAGQAGAPLDWWTVALTSQGTIRWAVRRDMRTGWDEVPAAIFVLPDGTSVVSGPGGPALEGGYVRGVTAGYSSSGAPVWEAFSPLATTWAAPLPDGNVCATGGYDALITCWRIPHRSTA